jgi:xanthine dehydrogenase accessory factor
MHNGKPKVLLLGCGDLGTGVAHRLFRAGIPVAVVELERPRAVRRRVSFAEAARHGDVVVEGVRCRRVCMDLLAAQWGASDSVLLVVEPLGRVLERCAPDVLVDARMSKQRLQPRPSRSIFFVALGPGHVAGRDCDVAVETLRGSDLGKLIHAGSAAPDTGIPGDVGGATATRVLRAPVDGVLRVHASIGASVQRGDVVAAVGVHEVRAGLGGVLRGMLADGDVVEMGQKLGDIDPRRSAPAVDLISDKARAVGDGVWGAVSQHFDLRGA